MLTHVYLLLCFETMNSIKIVSYQKHEFMFNIHCLYFYPCTHRPKNYLEINMEAVFISSIAVIVMHKLISCGAVYALTKNITDVFLQFIDFMMIKAVYLNYKLGTDEPGNAQRFLQIFEGTFESGPQLLISTAFITKTYDPDVGIDPIVLLSVMSSLWTLTSRVAADDKLILKNHWKYAVLPGAEFPYIKALNWRYFLRVICWRFFEISSRVFILVLFWVAVGGFALLIVMGIELTAAFILCYLGEGVIILGNMMYFTMSAVGNINQKILDSAATYKFISPIVFLILITVFCTVPFESWKVDDYEARREIITSSLKCFMLIYSWIVTPIYLCSIYLVRVHGKSRRSSVRSPEKLMSGEEFVELANLIQFGASLDAIYPNWRWKTGQMYKYNDNVLLYLAQRANEKLDQQMAINMLFTTLYERNAKRSSELVNEMVRNARGVLRKENMVETNCLGFAARNNLYLTKYLVETANMSTNGALEEAVASDKYDTARYLIEVAYADVQAISNSIQDKAWFYRMVQEERIVMMTRLALINATYGKWCLEEAVKLTKFDIVRHLIEKVKVDRNSIEDGECFAKLVNDYQENDTFIMDYLVIGNDKYGQWCFEHAVDQTRLEVMKYLVQGCNINVDKLDENGETYLFKAMKFDQNKLLFNNDVFGYLIDNLGIDPHVTNKDGRNCLWNIVEWSNQEEQRLKMLRYLIEIKNLDVGNRTLLLDHITPDGNESIREYLMGNDEDDSEK